MEPSINTFFSCKQGDHCGHFGFIQFITQYQHSSGEKRVRVTTLARPWVVATTDLPHMPHLTVGFDQEAAAVMMVRLSAFRAYSHDERKALRWLEGKLIRFVIPPFELCCLQNNLKKNYELFYS